MKAKSGILDKFQKTLNPVLWVQSGDSYNIKPKFKSTVLSKALEICKELGLEMIGMNIYGGNAGYQYGPKSDIDLSVYVDWDKADPSKYDEFWRVFKNSSFLYEGIETHLFLKSPEQKVQVETSENYYDLLNEKWKLAPVRYDFDPKEEFAREVIKALTLRQKMETLYRELREELRVNQESGLEKLPSDALFKAKILIYTVQQLRRNRDHEHHKIYNKALNGERITIYDRATETEICWKEISETPMRKSIDKLRKTLGYEGLESPRL